MEPDSLGLPIHAWVCPQCGAMLNVHILPETGEAYLGCDEPGCGWASHLADPDAGPYDDDFLDDL